MRRRAVGGDAHERRVGATLGPADRSLLRSRSRLSIALESVGSQSTLECLRPDRSSHFHSDEAERFAHTSSIASLRSLSCAHLNGREDPRIANDRFNRHEKYRLIGERDAERDEVLQRHVDRVDAREDAILAAKRHKAAVHTKRIGEQQLLALTRGMENGKMPILLEPGPERAWVPVPPHLSSHWKTISGVRSDPPPREEGKKATATGRRYVPERPPWAVDRPGVVQWGGSHAQL